MCARGLPPPSSVFLSADGNERGREDRISFSPRKGGFEVEGCRPTPADQYSYRCPKVPVYVHRYFFSLEKSAGDVCAMPRHEAFHSTPTPSNRSLREHRIYTFLRLNDIIRHYVTLYLRASLPLLLLILKTSDSSINLQIFLPVVMSRKDRPPPPPHPSNNKIFYTLRRLRDGTSSL